MRFLFPLSFVLISIVLFFSIVDPLYKETSRLRSDVSTYNTALGNSTELQKARDSLVDTYKNIKPVDKERLEHFLPNTVNNIKFILEVERIANIHSMPIRNIKFDPQKVQDTKITANGATSTVVIASNNPSDARPYGVFPIEFTTEGTYDQFSLFLKDLEYNLRLVDVKSVSFVVPPPQAKPGEGQDPNVYTYTLKVETYWLK